MSFSFRGVVVAAGGRGIGLGGFWTVHVRVLRI